MRETREGPNLKLYFDTYEKNLLRVLDQLIENICVYTQYWQENGICLTHGQNISDFIANATTNGMYLCLNGDWFLSLTTDELGKIKDCSVA